jgi:prepilin-type processing-associated H-X9-DG protein
LNHFKKNITNHKRFSLVELLIVISILAVLSSLLQPSISNALNASREISCKRKLSGLSTAISLYIDDYTRYPHTSKENEKSYTTFDSRLGAGYDGRKVSSHLYIVDHRNKAIEKSPETDPGSDIYQCPEDIDPEPSPLASSRGYIRGENVYFKSYALNGHENANLFEDNPSLNERDSYLVSGLTSFSHNKFPEGWGATEQSITAPSTTIAMSESFLGGMLGFQYSSHISQQGIDGGDQGLPKHNDGYNYLFADGSVQNLLQIETASTNPQNIRKGIFYHGMWSRDPND